MHEVDEAKAVHKVIISSVTSMMRKIDDIEERFEERSVNIDGRDPLTRDMAVLVVIQAFFCFSSRALLCPREGSVFIGPCSSRGSGHHVHPRRTHTCVEVEARRAFSFSFNVRGTFRPKRRAIRSKSAELSVKLR